MRCRVVSRLFVLCLVISFRFVSNYIMLHPLRCFVHVVSRRFVSVRALFLAVFVGVQFVVIEIIVVGVADNLALNYTPHAQTIPTRLVQVLSSRKNHY